MLKKFLCSAWLSVAMITVASDADGNFRRSKTIEKERPQLNAETQELITLCRRDPSATNVAKLRKQLEKNYDAVVERKKAKLAELRASRATREQVKEMEDIVEEMLKDRTRRVDDSLCRFLDPRFRPGAREAQGGFHSVLGAATAVDIAHTPVTNAEYAEFVRDTRAAAPKDWSGNTPPKGKEKFPVVNVSYEDAVAYCRYRSAKDKATYRLPTEREWELAAGHMPKDIDMNSGNRPGLTPVDAYEKTLAACGAIDMWGNCWEMTSSGTGSKFTVKGGAFDTKRTLCRTEVRDEYRQKGKVYADVGFRIVREK